MLGGLGRVGAPLWGEGVLGIGVHGVGWRRGEDGLHGIVSLVSVAMVTEGAGGPGTCIGGNSGA